MGRIRQRHQLKLECPFSNQTSLIISSSNGLTGFANLFGLATSLYVCIPENPKLHRLPRPYLCLGPRLYAQSNTGRHEITLTDRYRPFEDVGVVISWRFQLSVGFHMFDDGTVADIVMHISYTALNGGNKQQPIMIADKRR